MRNLILLAALGVALAGCDRAAEEADEPTASAAPAATEAAADTMAGTYEFEVDGVKTTAVLNPDGTYTDSTEGTVTETGTWMEMDGKTCFDPEGDPGETCFTSTEPDAEGVFVATPDEGEPLTIKKIS